MILLCILRRACCGGPSSPHAVLRCPVSVHEAMQGCRLCMRRGLAARRASTEALKGRVVQLTLFTALAHCLKWHVCANASIDMQMRTCSSAFTQQQQQGAGRASSEQPALLLTFSLQPPQPAPQYTPSTHGATRSMQAPSSVVAMGGSQVQPSGSPMGSAGALLTLDPALIQCVQVMPACVSILQWGGGKQDAVVYQNDAAKAYYGTAMDDALALARNGGAGAGATGATPLRVQALLKALTQARLQRRVGMHACVYCGWL